MEDNGEAELMHQPYWIIFQNGTHYPGVGRDILHFTDRFSKNKKNNLFGSLLNFLFSNFSFFKYKFKMELC